MNTGLICLYRPRVLIVVVMGLVITAVMTAGDQGDGDGHIYRLSNPLSIVAMVL